MISIIIPVYNEQEAAPRILERLRHLAENHLLCETLVVQGPGEDYPIPTLTAPNRGRAAQMNYGASLARGEILLFLHADTLLPVQALPLVARARTGAFSLRFDSPRVFFKLLALGTSLRSRLLRLPYGDQALFMPKALFQRMGGYPDVPLLEDVLLAEKIRPRVLPQHVVTSCRRYARHGAGKTVLRHRLIMLGHALGFSPERLAEWFRA